MVKPLGCYTRTAIGGSFVKGEDSTSVKFFFIADDFLFVVFSNVWLILPGCPHVLVRRTIVGQSMQ